MADDDKPGEGVKTYDLHRGGPKAWYVRKTTTFEDGGVYSELLCPTFPTRREAEAALSRKGGAA